MPSTINAQTTPFAAIVQEADNTGNLALQTANVTALTLDTNQNATFANVVTATTLVGSANASSLTTGTVATARLATGTANSSTFLRGDQTWTEVTQTRISGGTTGLTPSTLTSGDVTLAGTLAVANGGTGATTLTANNVLLGNGTSALQAVAPGSNGNILTSNGTTWQSTAPAAPTTAQVLTATAGASLGDVGAYSLCRFITSTAISAGSTTSGSNLRYAGATIGLSNTGTTLRTGTNGTTGLSGTWQAMGQHTPVSPDFPFMLWLRIS